MILACLPSLLAPVLLLLSTFPSPVAADDAALRNEIAPMKTFKTARPDARRGRVVQDILTTRVPIGVRTTEAGSNSTFALENWQFDEEGEREIARRLAEWKDDHARLEQRTPVISEGGNATMVDRLLPPLRPLSQDTFGQGILDETWRLFERSNLVARQFSCPSGYSSCSSISRPNICCRNGATCVRVSDTGIGDVGCCPAGASCSGQVLNCDASQGYKSCPGSSNGGCCIPNYDCNGIGCVSTVISTTTTTLPVSTVTPSTSSTSTSTSTPPTVIVPITSTTTSASASAPVRPIPSTSSTTNPPAVAPTTITTTSSQVIVACPTNYYVCSAYYPPCCYLFGAPCSASSCPAYESTSTFASNGVTILIPGGSQLPRSSLLSTSFTTATIVSGASGGPKTGLIGLLVFVAVSFLSVF